MSKNPYAALGLTKTATQAEIKKAYRKIARDSHPDLNPGDVKAETRFKAASAAHDLLKDADMRARFDKGEIDASGAEQQPGRKFYRDYARQPGHGYQSSHGYEDFGDMSDLFADILRQRGAQPARGADLRYRLEVDFLDAVQGGKQRLTLPSGDNIEVKIPAGTADGQTLRLRGKGGEGYGEGARGDAYVTINLRPHRLFTREGDDILLTLPITIDEAILGGKVATPTITGPVSLNIPKGASSGQILRLRGRGVKRAGQPAGDQRVELRIVAPPKIDTELEQFMQNWRKTHAHDPREGMTL